MVNVTIVLMQPNSGENTQGGLSKPFPGNQQQLNLNIKSIFFAVLFNIKMNWKTQKLKILNFCLNDEKSASHVFVRWSTLQTWVRFPAVLTFEWHVTLLTTLKNFILIIHSIHTFYLNMSP